MSLNIHIAVLVLLVILVAYVAYRWGAAAALADAGADAGADAADADAYACLARRLQRIVDHPRVLPGLRDPIRALLAKKAGDGAMRAAVYRGLSGGDQMFWAAAAAIERAGDAGLAVLIRSVPAGVHRLGSELQLE